MFSCGWTMSCFSKKIKEFLSCRKYGSMCCCQGALFFFLWEVPPASKIGCAFSFFSGTRLPKMRQPRLTISWKLCHFILVLLTIRMNQWCYKSKERTFQNKYEQWAARRGVRVVGRRAHFCKQAIRNGNTTTPYSSSVPLRTGTAVVPWKFRACFSSIRTLFRPFFLPRARFQENNLSIMW